MIEKWLNITSDKLMTSAIQTVYMVGWSLFFGALIGIPLGLILVLTRKGGLRENKIVYFIINTAVRLKIFEFFTRLLIILSSCFIMFITVAAIYESILSNFVIESKISSMILIMICAIFGILIYFFSITMMKFDEYLFGRKIKISSLRRLRR